MHTTADLWRLAGIIIWLGIVALAMPGCRDDSSNAGIKQFWATQERQSGGSSGP